MPYGTSVILDAPEAPSSSVQRTTFSRSSSQGIFSPIRRPLFTTRVLGDPTVSSRDHPPRISSAILRALRAELDLESRETETERAGTRRDPPRETVSSSFHPDERNARNVSDERVVREQCTPAYTCGRTPVEATGRRIAPLSLSLSLSFSL